LGLWLIEHLYWQRSWCEALKARHSFSNQQAQQKAEIATNHVLWWIFFSMNYYFIQMPTRNSARKMLSP